MSLRPLLVAVFGCVACSGGAPPEATCGAAHDAGWQTWTELPEALESPGVAEVGGRLWVTGGYDFATGARGEVVSLDLDKEAEGTGVWRMEGDLPAPTEHQGAVATTGGTVLLLGGDKDYGDEVRDVVWVGTPGDEGRITEWVEAEPLPQARTLHTVAIRRSPKADDVYVIGGTWAFNDSMVFSTSVWHTRVDSKGVPGSWEEVTALPAARGWSAATIRDGRLVVAGGLSAWGPAKSAAEVWSAELDDQGLLGAWQVEEPLPLARHRHSLSSLSGVLHVVGGDSEEGELDEVLVDGPEGWSLAEPLPAPRFSHGAVELDGDVVIVGGFEEFRQTRADVWSIVGCGGS